MRAGKISLNKPVLSFLGITGLLAIPLALVLIVGFTPPTITPNNQFFTLSINGTPQIDVNKWQMTVNGDVNHDLVFDYKGITSLPNVTETETLQCVDGPQGTATWTGVPLNTILIQAGVKADAVSIVFQGADGYSSSLTLPKDNASDVLLAWGMNGVPLPPDQGFPLRVVAPDNYGYKWVKWITQITLVNYVYEGYWESQGWSNDAHINTISGWQMHATLFSVAFIIGGFAAISGKRLSQGSTAFKGLPTFVNRKFHIVTAIAFLPVVVLAYIYWTTTFFAMRGLLFFELHGIASLASMGLIVIGSLLGVVRTRRNSGVVARHGGISMAGIYLFLITILLGLLYAAGINLFAGL